MELDTNILDDTNKIQQIRGRLLEVVGRLQLAEQSCRDVCAVVDGNPGEDREAVEVCTEHMACVLGAVNESLTELADLRDTLSEPDATAEEFKAVKITAENMGPLVTGLVDAAGVGAVLKAVAEILTKKGERCKYVPSACAVKLSGIPGSAEVAELLDDLYGALEEDGNNDTFDGAVYVGLLREIGLRVEAHGSGADIKLYQQISDLVNEEDVSAFRRAQSLVSMLKRSLTTS